MSSEENKQIVADGLERRKAERVAAEQEAKLEAYEQDQINAIHERCADARMKRDAEEHTQRTIQQAAARRAAIAQAQEERQRREDTAMRACRYYGVVCLVIMWLAAVTHLPWWAAVALAMGLAVIWAAYIFRVFCPIQRKANA